MKSRLLGMAAEDPRYAEAMTALRAAEDSAKLLRSLRERAGKSQKEVAAMLGVSQARISQVESGSPQYTPAIDFVYRFADACGARVSLVETAKGSSGAKAARAKSASGPVADGHRKAAADRTAATPAE